MTQFSMLEMAIMTQFGEYITLHRHVHGGIHLVLEFPNHFAASFINHKGSQGNEIAIIKDGVITSDVSILTIGGILHHLTEKEVPEVIGLIKSLDVNGH